MGYNIKGRQPTATFKVGLLEPLTCLVHFAQPRVDQGQRGKRDLSLRKSRDDWGGELVGAGGGATYKLGRAAKIARTAKIAAAASGGIAGIGFGPAGDFLWKLGSNSIETALAADEVHYRYKARYKHCTEVPVEKL